MAGEMKIGVVGCAGRMGRMLLKQIAETGGCAIAGGTEMAGGAAVGRDVGELAGLGPLGLGVGDNPAPLFAEADAVIDFTVPAASVGHAALAAANGTVHIIGTTGMSPTDEAVVAQAAERAAIVMSGNMSLGVNLLVTLVEKVAAALDEDFDVEVVEMHHRHKVDAPSGTALMLGKAAALGRGITHDDHAVLSREGHTGPRNRGDIGYATLRGGNVVGEHSVIFAADNERIEISHKAADRAIFARGAVKAALWARDRKPGLYTMRDVLGL